MPARLAAAAFWRDCKGPSVKEKMAAAAAWIRSAVDRRDVLGLIGLGMLTYGGEAIYPGAGLAAGGAVLVAVAVLVR